jgi:hypothetical protein
MAADLASFRRVSAANRSGHERGHDKSNPHARTIR